MAELAMHHLAKVDHAGSSPALRSIELFVGEAKKEMATDDALQGFS
jgi:hypothetical protein